jgi:hypothetical protein
MLPSNDKPKLKVPTLVDGIDDDEDPKEIEKHLDLPPSWVKPFEITLKGLYSHIFIFLDVKPFLLQISSEDARKAKR